VTVILDISEAKAQLSELVFRLEAGEQILIARDNKAVAQLKQLRRGNGVRAAIAEFRAAREGHPPASQADILAWRDEGRRVP
jgi:antitoxin (DNA-binding transcriptional repressor) of toxin-antitoxin stability system